MLTAQQALDHLLSHAKPVTQTESVPMQASLGRVLAENVNSLVDVPPLDNTSMDGYAVRTADALLQDRYSELRSVFLRVRLALN
jgi:molybdopterin molybdotransferase